MQSLRNLAESKPNLFENKTAIILALDTTGVHDKKTVQKRKVNIDSAEKAPTFLNKH
jgi:hypothetical protein